MWPHCCPPDGPGSTNSRVQSFLGALVVKLIHTQAHWFCCHGVNPTNRALSKLPTCHHWVRVAKGRTWSILEPGELAPAPPVMPTFISPVQASYLNTKLTYLTSSIWIFHHHPKFNISKHSSYSPLAPTLSPTCSPCNIPILVSAHPVRSCSGVILDSSLPHCLPTQATTQSCQSFFSPLISYHLQSIIWSRPSSFLILILILMT